MANQLENDFELSSIDIDLANRIKEEKFMNITDDYETYGIGFCCMYHHEIVGVASSNIVYKDGIEVNIRVKEKYQRKGIATAMAAKLILECFKEKKKVSWDAANMSSVGLAEKLGFEYDSKYRVYCFLSH
ncbi:MAG: GNAT family N-acetyltransferase [Firmicutes bacterium]|nr:GNAT family N-acetyltransferase [Bacillota bacterium]